MKLRAGIFPIVNVAGQLWFPLFIMGIIMGASAGVGQLFIQLAIIAFAGILAFHVVTLPVEVNASTRAYGQLHPLRVTVAQRGFRHQAGALGGGIHLHSGGAYLPVDAGLHAAPGASVET